jgi:fatty acid amide hydrolase
VVRAHIARIEQVNPQINALVVPRFEQALAEANAADQRQAAGQALEKLHGVPMTLKECFYLAGTPSSIGLGHPSWRKPLEHDGILTRRLRQAGAIVLGKTNLPQLMIWHESDNPVYGRTNNPWDLARTPGGSTGGEAAIIAAHGSPLGLGNDLGGSIRIPCHFCGIHGLKPTSFRLPRAGAVRTLRGFEAIVTQPGPMARHVEDLWLALQVLADDSDGHVAGDVPPGKLGDPAAVKIEGLRIAMWTDDGLITPSPAIQRAVREAGDSLRDRGVIVEELSASDLQSVLKHDDIFDTYCSLLAADGGASARKLSDGSPLDWRVDRMRWVAGLSPTTRTLVDRALRLQGQRWLARIVTKVHGCHTKGFWRLIEHKNARVMAVVDLLKTRGIQAILCPTYSLPAPPHVKAYDLLPAASHAFQFNLLGFPAGVISTTRVRAGEDVLRPDSRDQTLRQAQATDQGSVGLPVAVQVAALPWREDIVLAVMGALEEAFRNRTDFPGRFVVPEAAALPTGKALLDQSKSR